MELPEHPFDLMIMERFTFFDMGYKRGILSESDVQGHCAQFLCSLMVFVSETFDGYEDKVEVRDFYIAHIFKRIDPIVSYYFPDVYSLISDQIKDYSNRKVDGLRSRF